jgi:malonyl-CoA/methylmalonyl-CoA synthetase
MQLIDIFNLSLIGRAATEALEYDSADGATATLTFGDIDARSNAMARVLAARGLARGDRLGFFLPNCVEFIDLFWRASNSA